jgi:hypothetical protein
MDRSKWPTWLLLARTLRRFDLNRLIDNRDPALFKLQDEMAPAGFAGFRFPL